MIRIRKKGLDLSKQIWQNLGEAKSSIMDLAFIFDDMVMIS